MKLALLLNAIDPLIGGVLIMGHRGTGKSTAVRALADLLPPLVRVRDCAYGCDPEDERHLCDECHQRLASTGSLPRERAAVPVIDLPLGATEDRVCGTIDIERALKDGIKAYEPGLLARANRGFLYIDEVNLLEDHLIDLLLDASITGRNVVEREGASIEHPARFVLIGSGNPEEGALRPQLIDRFGLHAEVKTASKLDDRINIVEQREAFERSPSAFYSASTSDQNKLRRSVVNARKQLDKVKLPRILLRKIAELCQELKVDGHRGELTIARASRALASLERRKEVLASDIRRVAKMALRHRMRRDPLDQGPGGTRIDQQLDKSLPSQTGSKQSADSKDGSNKARTATSSNSGSTQDMKREGVAHQSSEQGSIDRGESKRTPPSLSARISEDVISAHFQDRRRINSRSAPTPSSRGNQSTSESSRRGRYTRATPLKSSGAKIALDATVRAYAQTAVSRNGSRSLTANLKIQSELRYKRFKRKEGTLFIFAIDTSGSMALNRIAEAKGALVRLLRQSYIKRDRIAIVSFRGTQAELLMRPGGSVSRAARLLDEMSVGGATPLAAGVMSALGIADEAARAGTKKVAILLFTDGRANVSLSKTHADNAEDRQRVIVKELERIGAAIRRVGVETVMVDTRNRFTSNGDGLRIAGLLGARYLQLESAISPRDTPSMKR